MAAGLFIGFGNYFGAQKIRAGHVWGRPGVRLLNVSRPQPPARTPEVIASDNEMADQVQNSSLPVAITLVVFGFALLAGSLLSPW